MDKTGLACNADNSNCGAFTDVAGVGAPALVGEGYNGSNLNIMSWKSNGTTLASGSALNTSMQNTCGTSLSMWT